MKRSLLALTAVVALAAGTMSTSLAQETTAGPASHPLPLVGGQTATPPQGTVPSAMSEQPARVSPVPPGPLQPGPPAGVQGAATLSNAVLVTGGVAVTGAVVCALTCYSSSTSTTTSTVATHR